MEPTQALSRTDRARLAKETVNKTILGLLYSRARADVAGAQLLRD
jgi:hypothetical protein